MGLWLVSLLVCGADKPAGPAVVALVLRSSPGATLQRDRDRARPLRDLEVLQVGDVIVSGKEAVRLVLLDDGHGESVQPGKKATVGKAGCAPAASVEKVARKLGPAGLKSLRRMADTWKAGVRVLRTGPVGAGPVSPTPGGYVLRGKPTFRWPAVKGAVRYEVRLYSGKGDERKLRWKAFSRKTSLAWPAEQPALPAGASDTWDVIAILAEDVEKFAVSGSELLVPTTAGRKRLDEAATLARSTDDGDRLLAAALYEQARAYDAAFALYQEAAKQRPDEPNLLLALYRHHTRTEDRAAAEALKKRLAKLGIDVKKAH